MLGHGDGVYIYIYIPFHRALASSSPIPGYALPLEHWLFDYIYIYIVHRALASSSPTPGYALPLEHWLLCIYIYIKIAETQEKGRYLA